MFPKELGSIVQYNRTVEVELVRAPGAPENVTSEEEEYIICLEFEKKKKE